MYINVLNWDSDVQMMIDDFFGFEHHQNLYNVQYGKLSEFCKFCQDWNIQIDYCIHCGNTGILEYYESSTRSHYGLELVTEECPYCDNSGNGESAYDRYKDSLYD